MLKAYIITTIISAIVTMISLRAISDRLKREGYTNSEIKYSTAEKLKAYLYLLIPVFNIILALACLLKEDIIYTNTKKTLKDRDY